MSAVAPANSIVMDVPKTGLPVTIITGFLGSGKTTLLNHILSNQQGVKTAVLVNEFGEIGIDNELIVATDETGTMIELSNGCICCTINEDLQNAVYKILEREDKVDYLVVETTGLADPLPVALTFLGSELRDLTRLDSIVTVVDAENFSLDLFNSEVAYNQIAYGDIVLLNKSDLVDEATLDSLEVRVRDIKEGARILRTSKGNVPLSLLLSVGLFESDQYFDADGNKRQFDQAGQDHTDCDHDHGQCAHDDHAGHDHASHDHDDHGHKHDDHGHKHDDHGHKHAGHDHGHDHDHDHAGHDHDHAGHDHAHGGNPDHLEIEGFTSLSFSSDRPFSIRKFQYFLDNQLSANIFRAKGILWFDESPNRHIFHLSGKRFSLDDDQWKDGATPKNQLVLIGQNLDHAELREQIENCLTTASGGSGKGFAR
jgi:G3E family GTPase